MSFRTFTAFVAQLITFRNLKPCEKIGNFGHIFRRDVLPSASERLI
jgi:hypothetical protein